MNPNLAKVLALLVYTVIDVLYITWQKPLYAGAVQKVQGAMMGPVPLYFAVLAYLSILVGFLFLVAPQITKETSYTKSAVVGAAFGVTIYGTFAFTNASMFQNYRGRVIWQDFLWGTSLSIVTALLYKTILTKA